MHPPAHRQTSGRRADREPATQRYRRHHRQHPRAHRADGQRADHRNRIPPHTDKQVASAVIANRRAAQTSRAPAVINTATAATANGHNARTLLAPPPTPSRPSRRTPAGRRPKPIRAPSLRRLGGREHPPIRPKDTLPSAPATQNRKQRTRNTGGAVTTHYGSGNPQIGRDISTGHSTEPYTLAGTSKSSELGPCPSLQVYC